MLFDQLELGRELRKLLPESLLLLPHDLQLLRGRAKLFNLLAEGSFLGLKQLELLDLAGKLLLSILEIKYK